MNPDLMFHPSEVQHEPTGPMLGTPACDHEDTGRLSMCCGEPLLDLEGDYCGQCRDHCTAECAHCGAEVE